MKHNKALGVFHAGLLFEVDVSVALEGMACGLSIVIESTEGDRILSSALERGRNLI